MAAKLILKLYVVGETALLKKAVKELRHILTGEFDSNYNLTVVDILKHPEVAEKDKIIAAPTLLKLLPPPARKIIGDLSNKEKLLSGLGLYTLKKQRIGAA